MPHAEEVCSFFVDKKMPGKSKDEQMAEKKQELEKRLLDVNDKRTPTSMGCSSK
jgi:hypothetical protein